MLFAMDDNLELIPVDLDKPTIKTIDKFLKNEQDLYKLTKCECNPCVQAQYVVIKRILTKKTIGYFKHKNEAIMCHLQKQNIRINVKILQEKFLSGMD